MITKEQIENCLLPKLEADNVYIVELKTSATNQITILLDSFKGITINYCVDITRLIEANFDREEEDYELIISSAGASGPFKIINQYHKNIGSEVLVKPKEAKPQKGILESVNEEDFTITYSEKEKVEGKKKKIEVQKKITYRYDEIVSTELVLKF